MTNANQGQGLETKSAVAGFLREFGEELSIAQQVQRLIEQATSHLNLCQCYVGWCPFW